MEGGSEFQRALKSHLTKKAKTDDGAHIQTLSAEGHVQKKMLWFDNNTQYGPRMNITRMTRMNRALALGIAVPDDIVQHLNSCPDDAKSVWRT